MGVACTAYEHVELVEARPFDSMTDDDWEALDWSKRLFLYNLDPFIERGDGLVEGIYATNGRSDRIERAYGGYNRFREKVCESVLGVEPRTVWNDYASYEAQPFAPWIHFADNEGFLGPKTCARLAADAERATPTGLDDFDDWPGWVRLFRMAADTGVIYYS